MLKKNLNNKTCFGHNFFHIRKKNVDKKKSVFEFIIFGQSKVTIYLTIVFGHFYYGVDFHPQS